ncbi:MAG TPA: T9SS type A sorting domain-containing protein [Flavobacterium lutivivi]|nr:T9SS type A sorting domain-containing protein [Flavobacterium lutivivi]
MKKTCLLIFFITVSCYTQIINFPDANFKAKLLGANATNGNACIGSSMDNCVSGVIDTNGDGEIEVAEAEAVAILFLTGNNITNLTGIEYFTNLERLDCPFQNNLININLSQNTSLKSLNFNNNHLISLSLSGLSQLEILGCSNNQLTSLDISEQTQLKMLLCEGNQITSIDFSNNPALQRVYCGNNQLSSLDFGANHQFFDLGCRNNPNLTSINIRNGMIQAFGTGTLYNQCWSNIPNLNYICADSNEIPALQSFLAGCGITQSITIDSACPLSVNEFDSEKFAVHPNPSNGVFWLTTKQSFQEKIVYSVYDVLGKKILEKVVSNDISSTDINLENFPVGIYLLHIKTGEVVVNKKLIKN